MSKKKEATEDVAYSEGQSVIILDTRSEYVNQTGIINRIGFAGPFITYYHIIFPHHITPITFTESQISRVV